ncbi:MAG: oligosaccharide flippase family protein [Methylotenera sp.]|uniref:oligosaccharide flippase family protein n=1 Tax=Methylotenera sp. TaxID=2051956 RepID=UPI00271E29FE|nr:oligosaccharide flippase family protein [Methylotenera sp.]MDO9206076.1 oligosaccharide flippase family protein [Methylotenera sp.]MDP2402207.1 oligosaccharide flippase family protein [Methylotenera sp.]MDP3094276.1 oligosaccharide flippase family protein [Methylotenera sp.]MDZ4223967.1 oligosaccharide flippase family protein [Methylotenera sp.]
MNLLARLKCYLRFDSFDVKSQEGRAKERHRQILLTTLSSGAARILTVIISFVMITLALKFLGAERFGLWVTISSAVAMLGFADLGVGSGLMNAVANAHGKDDIMDVKRKIALGILLLSVIAIFILIVFFIVYPFVPWTQLLNVNSELAIKEVAPTIAVVVIFFALSIPAGIVIKVQMGLQMGFAANLWLSAGSVLALVAALGVIFLNGGLPYLVAATIAPPVIVSTLAGIYFFYIQKPFLRPRFRGLRVGDAKELAGTSGFFLVLQFSGLIAFQSDNLIIAHYLGVDAVAKYAIAFKLFSLPLIILSLYLNAMWPAYAEAKSRGDMEWVYSTFQKSIRLSAIIVLPLSFVLLVASTWIIDVWVGSSFEPSWSLLIGLFFWSIMSVVGGNFAVLLNGLGVIRFQVITSVSMAIVNIILSVWLVQRIGVSGVIWGSVLTLLFIVYIPTAIYLRKYFK